MPASFHAMLNFRDYHVRGKILNYLRRIKDFKSEIITDLIKKCLAVASEVEKGRRKELSTFRY